MYNKRWNNKHNNSKIMIRTPIRKKVIKDPVQLRSIFSPVFRVCRAWKISLNRIKRPFSRIRMINRGKWIQKFLREVKSMLW